MKKFLSVLALVFTVGCVNQMGVRSAVNTAANAILPGLVAEYKADQIPCASKPTEQEAITCVDIVRSTWKPVWDAWDALRTANDAVDSWCKFLSAVKNAGVKVPPSLEVVTCG